MGDSTNNSVFIIRGRDHRAYDAIRELVVAMGVTPVAWGDVTRAMGRNNPPFGQVLEHAFKTCRAVIVLLTPDETAILRANLWKDGDERDTNQTGPVGQPRPNVLYELGYAMKTNRQKTIVVLFRGCRVPSDLYGLHTIEHDTAHPDQTVDSLRHALRNARLDVNEASTSDLLPPHGALRQLPSLDFGIREFVRAGTSVKTSEFAFDRVLDGQCDTLLITGTNFGDQFGRRGQPIVGLLDRLKRQLLERPNSRITLVFAPPDLLGRLSQEALDHLRDCSLPRLCDLYDDPDFDETHRRRLRIGAHPGAMFFQAFVRDPDDKERALLVATPRWLSDASGRSRFYFAVTRQEHPEMFEALYSNIPTDLDRRTFVPFDVVARELEITRRA